VALSSQGVTLLAKQRPSDVLKAALVAGGPESVATKSFFGFLGEDQACATALVLACFEPSLAIVEAATRAFLLLGAERRAAAPAAHTPILFNPSSVSTPIRYAANFMSSIKIIYFNQLTNKQFKYFQSSYIRVYVFIRSVC